MPQPPLEFGQKLPGKEYTLRPGAYAVLIHEDGKIGLIQNQAGFFLAGGGIDEGETPEEALHREVMEEIAGTVEILEKIGEAVDHHFADSLNEHFSKHGHFYKARLLSWQDDQGESDHSLHWFTPKEALEKIRMDSQAWAVKSSKP